MMPLNYYETIYILKPDVTEDVNLSLVSDYKILLKQQGAINVSVQHRGRRHLSYNIINYYDGIYVQMNYQANGKLVRLMEKSMKLNNNVIRHLTVKKNTSLVNIY